MNKDYPAEFVENRKKELLRAKKYVEDELKHIGTCNLKGGMEECKAKIPQFGDKEEDNATEVQVYDDYNSLENNLGTLLNEIIKALAKIEKGTYGQCDNCSKLIPAKRLEAFPAAPICIDCKKKEEASR